MKSIFSRLRSPNSFPIRYKLLLIISSILVVSMTGVIFFATYFFRKDSELRVREQNIKTNEILSLQIKGELNALRHELQMVTVASAQNKDRAKAFTEELFSSNQSILYFATLNQDELENEVWNNKELVSYEFTKSDMASIIRKVLSQKKILKLKNIGLQNISPEFSFPILFYHFPLSESTKTNKHIIALVKMDHLQESFQTTGGMETFLVSDAGEIIAHPDASIVLKGKTLQNSPLLEKIQMAKLDNGQFQYSSKDGISYLGAFKKVGLGGMNIVSQVEEDRIFEEVYNIQRRNLYFLIISLTLAFIVVYLFAKSLSTPILRLVDASEEIRRGQYHIELEATSKDEIGELTNSFVSMSRGLEEREKLKDSFGKFVNEDLVELAAKGKLSLGGTQKHCTIFFSDIRRFTEISEKLRPTEVVEFLNRYMTEMVQCVQETGGNVDKFIGDAIMATWGALRENRSHAKHAVDAALKMRARLVQFNKGRGSAKNPIIQIGCGINTGNVVAGQIGSSDKMEYTVIGDAVNLASRIESLCKEYGADILISATTKDEIGGDYVLESIGSIPIKGKSKPEKIFAVLGKKNESNTPRTLAELRNILGLEMKRKRV